MKNAGIGVALGLIGAMLWYMAVVVNFLLEAFADLMEIFSDEPFAPPPQLMWNVSGMSISKTDVLLYFGFTLMIAGPLTYWVILPIIEFNRRRKGQ